MGLRLKKSFKIAPGVKLNLNKNSTSVTFGKRGAHYTINSKGKKTTSVGIPGTGISYTKTMGDTSSRNRSNSNSKEQNGGSFMSENNFSDPGPNGPGKKWYQKTGWIILLLILFFPVGLFLMWKYTNWKKPIKGIITALILIIAFSGLSSEPKLEQISLSGNINELETYNINEAVSLTLSTTPTDYEIPESDIKCSGGNLNIMGKQVIFSAPKTGKYRVWVEHDGVKSNKVVINIEDKKAIELAEKEAQEKAEEEARIKAEEAKKAEAEAKKAEEEAAAQAAAQKAEEERIAAEAAQAAQSSQPQEQMVWISATGSKYHNKSSCGKMNPNNATQITLSDAQSRGYTPCKKCY